MKNPRFATGLNAAVLEQMYERWKATPGSLDERWNAFFEGFELALEMPPGDGAGGALAQEGDAECHSRKQARFTGAIYAYRALGHTQADLDPLADSCPSNPRLALKRLGFDASDMGGVYHTGNYMGGVQMSVEEMIGRMKATYCSTIGVEYLHIQETPRRRWLQAAMEPVLNRPAFAREKKLRLLDRIIKAESFEKFLHTRYAGQKRFGLEGGETMIAALDVALELGPSIGIEEIVMGMAHRGRLNVLANILGKSNAYIFREFSSNYIPDTTHGDGDVKYHLGYDSIVTNSSGESLIVQLAANPSHLEAVDSVVEGKVRARQRILGDTERRSRVLPLLIHGDAAFAGQGVVAEVLNFSQLKGYRTGGTLHFIVNNQIGFTTDPSEARSSRYCTDVAKMIEAPVFHVNGDDPEAVAWVMELALRYRQQFSADAVVDMYCYRRHGHNEVDEPSFTQPALYRKIDAHPLVSQIYAGRLRAAGELDEAAERAMREKHPAELEREFRDFGSVSEDGVESWKARFHGSNAVYQPAYSHAPVDTGVGRDKLDHVAKAICGVPPGFAPNPKILRLLETRRQLLESEGLVDWPFAESLAWGTLLLDGIPVRLSGQDVARGTFSQRHAVLYDNETQDAHIPLMHMEGRMADICIHNSLLSEAAVLGFDYGYSLDFPRMLCIWEAQFGDFANGAQVIIDQFISASESKWQRISGLVMLLPHGYEGQGPEHSHARLERFLQLCAEDNLQVCNLTTPAQYFHALRRQMLRDFRKPLIVMSPKSLLRSKDCRSHIGEFTDGIFHGILDDPSPPSAPERVVFCSGKVFYDLVAYRRENPALAGSTCIMRIEQLYPLDELEIRRLMDARCVGVRTVVWCQEEPRNMGAWSFITPRLERITGMRPVFAGRKESASPAVGSLTLHKKEQATLVEAAFSVH